MKRTVAASLAILAGLSVAHGDDAPLPPEFDRIKTIVVVYSENRSFAHLLPDHPGAFGIADAAKDTIVQRDRDGSVLASLPPVWAEGSNPPAADPAYPDAMPNAPFDIAAPPYDLPSDILTVTPVHRFYQNRMQINGGRNDMFVAWTDVGSLVMGHYSSEGTWLQKLAAEFTLADRFFMGAYGGSNLNHFWLVCACSPHWQDAPERDRSVLDEAGNLKLAPDSPGSALAGPPRFVSDGSYSPDGHVVNTVQPAYQPSAVPPPLGGDQRLADPGYHPLPPQTGETIGSLLSARGIDWAWYAEGWDVALADRGAIYNTRGAVNFQPHHQPFNYYAAYAPGTLAREQHLKDMKQFWIAAEAGALPAVVFVKPDGTSNQHPGESTMAAGDLMIGTIVSTLRRSPQWDQMAVIVTHDENGGFWDPVAPPAGDDWGPGSRIPTVIASPFVRKGFVDHTAYDTTSILQFIAKRFDLPMLPGIRTGLGDLRNAFAFGD
ncbi:MAG: acid phosphatase [Bauldia sp.]|nr:acid phosphatase [Bauldia sp.]